MNYADMEAAVADAVVLDGMPLLRVSEAEFIRLALDAIERHRGINALTVNMDILQRFVREAGFRDYLGNHVAVADGMPVVWATRLLGVPVPERVPGSSLVSSLPIAALNAGMTVLLLGGQSGVAQTAAEVLRRQVNGSATIHAMGLPNPISFDDESLGQLGRDLALLDPQVILVSLGSPKTERLIHSIRASAPHALWMGVGAGFDFLTGRLARAPRFTQQLGLEWAWRLHLEPTRLVRRYLVDDLPYACRLLLKCAWLGVVRRSAKS